MKPWFCSICGKRGSSESAIADHARGKHPKTVASAIRRKSGADTDESYADRAVQAEQDKAAGIYNADRDWLLPLE